MNTKERVQHLFDLSGCKSQAQFARLVQLSPSYISQLLLGDKTELAPKSAGQIASRLRVSYDWVLEDKGPPPEKISIPDDEPELVEVRIWEWAGMGGAYALREQDYEAGLEPLRTIMLPLEVVGDWRDAFEAHGDSMEPTLSEGDIVGIDFSDRLFRSGRVFAIYSAYEGYSIKRLEDQSPYGILIKSDNPNIQAYRIDHDKIEHDLQIIGRVAWVVGQRKPKKNK